MKALADHDSKDVRVELILDDKEEACRKVVLAPGLAPPRSPS